MKPNDQQIRDAIDAAGGNKSEAARQLGVSRGWLYHNLPRGPTDQTLERRVNVSIPGATSEEDLVKAANADPALFEVYRSTVNEEGWITRVWLRRKRPDALSAQRLLDDMKAHSVKVPPWHATVELEPRRALEVCVMDPHLGLQSFRPGSDHAWDLDKAEAYFMWAIEGLLRRAEKYAPFEKIVWVFGNDYLHADNLDHSTTKRTPQAEMVSYMHTYDRGKRLAIAAAERLKTVAPLEIVQVSGNHDYLASFSLGHVLDAYYHADENVTVEVNPSPYKFWHYGVNLVGFNHQGKKAERMGVLMANEVPEAWAASRYREWHVGDQHRRGSGSPVAMTEQGVGIEFLTGLTPANEWHRLQTFNWQPRGATAYVWGYHTGPEDRLLCNLDSYTGRPMGEFQCPTMTFGLAA